MKFSGKFSIDSSNSWQFVTRVLGPDWQVTMHFILTAHRFTIKLVGSVKKSLITLEVRRVFKNTHPSLSENRSS